VASGTRRLVPVVHERDSHIDVGGCSLSSSGQYVAYLVRVDNLTLRVCVHDIKLARTVVLDAGRPHTYWILCADPPALSADGRRAVFVRKIHDGKNPGDAERDEVAFAEIEW
jgi:hypothetical protein